MAVKRTISRAIGVYSLLSFLAYTGVFGNNKADSTITVSGFTYDSVNGTSLEGTGIFFYRFRDNIEVVTHSNDQGRYSMSLPPGNYVVRALKFGYLASLRKVYELTNDTTGLDFGFTAPVFSADRDSIFVDASGSETVTDTLLIENTGSGELFFSAALAATENDLLVLSKTSSLNRTMRNFPALRILDLTKPSRTAEVSAPADSLWTLVHHDPEDNNEGTLDIHETWMQVKDNQLYLKVTFHHPIKAAFRNFEYSLGIDTDGDRNTGEAGGWDWIGPDYIIAVSDYGLGPMAVLGRWDYDQYRYVQQANFSSLGSNVFICGFPLSVFGNVKILSFLSGGRNLSNPETDIDFVPEYNTGFLVFSTKENPGLCVEPHYGVLQPNEKDTLIVTMDSSFFPGEHHKSYILFSCNQPMKPIKLIPIVLKTQTGVKVTRQQPKECLLLQNYPNPFNPSTTIKYSISCNSFVSLIIYNIFGQEVDTLINKNQNIGTHETEFDGSHLASGIYYYKLQVGSFLDTKKFILLK
jgi:hypothetical protein